MKKLAIGAASTLLAALPAFGTITGLSTTTTITLVPTASVVQFTSAKAIGQTIDVNHAPVTSGNAYLQIATDAYGAQTTCALRFHIVPSGGPKAVDSTGSAQFSLNTMTVGTFGYRISYVSSNTNAYRDSQSPCVDLTVTPACSGVQIAADLADGWGNPSPGFTHTWEVEIKVHACEAATGLKVQGGSNSWAETSIGTPSVGETSVKLPGKSSNSVITWSIDSLNAGEDATLLLTITGAVKPKTPSGTVLGLTGPWSVVYSTDGGVTYQKSSYAGSVTVTVN